MTQEKDDPTIRMDAFRDKLLVIADGHIDVRINDKPMATRARLLAHWPAAAIATTIALLSSAVTLLAVDGLRSDLTRRLDAQDATIATHLQTAFADAQAHADDKVEMLLLRDDRIDSKIELLPERIDTAAKDVTGAIADFKQALAALGQPAKQAPILVIKRRKAALETLEREK